MTITEFFIAPFADYAFMRRALVACIVLAVSGAPIGVFINLRRMALVGDALSHAILPGVATAFLFFGLSVWPMTAAAFIAGIIVATSAFFLTQRTLLKEDGAFTLIYLMSLSVGVVMISSSGSGVDLLHILFGNILAIDNAALLLACGVACLTLLVGSQIYRGLIIECFDSDFMRSITKGSNWIGQLFFILLVINLVASFQILGTLMALGLMILPAISTRFWTNNIDKAIPLSIVLAVIASFSGLILSFHADIPSGPAVVLIAAGMCLVSILLGPKGSLRTYFAR